MDLLTFEGSLPADSVPNLQPHGGQQKWQSRKGCRPSFIGIEALPTHPLAAKSRDVNESDTSMIVTDMMADLFGYDKYSEVTRELCIRGTFCDLATRIDGKFQMLIEVKAIGMELKDPHVKQAVDYAANQGIEWVALTSGNIWKVYRVFFTKPIGTELVLDIDLLALNPKNRRPPREPFPAHPREHDQVGPVRLP